MLTQPSSSFKLLVRASAAPPSLSFIRKSLSMNFAWAVLTISRVMNTAMGTMSCSECHSKLGAQYQPHTTPSTFPTQPQNAPNAIIAPAARAAP